MDLRELFSESRPKVGVLPSLDAVLTRRVLVNYRADPVVIRRLVPAPLELATRNGCAVVGFSLMELAALRMRGMSPAMGLRAESMAHYAAIRSPAGRTSVDGLFIWRRDTDSPLLAQLGGRLVPAEFRPAVFDVHDGAALSADVSTEEHEADMTLRARPAWDWRPTPLFEDLHEARRFCRARDWAFARSRNGGGVGGVRLPPTHFEVIPLRVLHLRSAFFENLRYFPPRAVAFDSAVLLRSVAQRSELRESETAFAGNLAAAA